MEYNIMEQLPPHQEIYEIMMKKYGKMNENNNKNNRKIKNNKVSETVRAVKRRAKH